MDMQQDAEYDSAQKLYYITKGEETYAQTPKYIRGIASPTSK